MMEEGLVSPLALNASSLRVSPMEGLLQEIKAQLVLADGDGFVRRNVLCDVEGLRDENTKPDLLSVMTIIMYSIIISLVEVRFLLLVCKCSQSYVVISSSN